MLNGKTALILEDEPIIGFALEDTLETIGCATVHTALRIEEARRVLETLPVDIAVLDVNIHGERSYPIADMLAARAVPFIFATGYGELEHPPRYRDVPTVTKPYSPGDLQAALARAVSG